MFEKEMIPDIRFIGCDEPWEESQLGELALFNPKSELPDIFEYVDLESVVGTEMIAHKTETKETAPSRAQRLAQYGDLFYQMVRPYQKNNYLFKIHDGSFVFSTGYAQIRPYIDGSFLMNLIQNESFVKSVLDNCTGTGYPAINSRDLAAIEVFYTTNTTEQTSIGTFFTHIDALITLNQRKYDKLISLKKSMLQKMFPRNGTDVPEIRFAGFKEPWKMRLFSEITFFSGEKNKSDIPYESYSITNEHGFIPQDEKFENGGTMKNANKRMYYIVSPQSFAYNPARINVGSIGYQAFNKNVIVSSLYEVFKTTEDVDDRFLWHWFKSSDFQKLILQLQEGGVRLYFYYDKLCMGTIFLPCVEEQEYIGTYFDKLDRLITLQQSKIEKLKQLKKSLLEKMFV